MKQQYTTRWYKAGTKQNELPMMLPNQFQNIVDPKIWIIEHGPVLISLHPVSYDVEKVMVNQFSNICRSLG